MRAIVAGDVTPAERDDYLRGHVNEADPQRRDMVMLKASRALAAMNRAQAIAWRLPLAVLQDYQARLGEPDRLRAPNDSLEVASKRLASAARPPIFCCGFCDGSVARCRGALGPSKRSGLLASRTSIGS